MHYAAASPTATLHYLQKHIEINLLNQLPANTKCNLPFKKSQGLFMSLADQFLKQLWVASKSPNPQQQLVAKRELFTDINTCHYCLTAFSLPPDKIDGSILTLCACILESFIPKSGINIPLLHAHRLGLVEKALAVLSNPDSVGVRFGSSISRFLSSLHLACPFDFTSFINLAFQLTNSDDEVKVESGFALLGFCSLAFRRSNMVNTEHGMNFIRNWIDLVPRFFNIETIFNPKTANIITAMMHEFSGNMKAWFMVSYLSDSIFVSFNEFLKKIVELGTSCTVIADEEVRKACVEVVQAFFSTLRTTSETRALSSPCDEVILDFQKTPLYADIYLNTLLAIPHALKVFTTDCHRQIAESMLMLIARNLSNARSLGFFEKPEVLKQLYFDVYSGAELLEVNCEMFLENPEAFYQDAFLNESAGLRNLTCAMQKELCGMFGLDATVAILSQFPASEGLMRLVSIVCKCAEAEWKREQLSEEIVPVLCALVDYASQAQDFPGDPSILLTSKLFLMADQLFLRSREDVAQACELVMREGLLKNVESSGGILFTLGCKIIKSVLSLGCPVPDDVLSHMFQRTRDCISVDMISIIETSILEHRECLPPPGEVLAFLFQEVIRIADSNAEETSRTEEKRMQHCYRCIRAMYDNGAPIEPFVEFWNEYFEHSSDIVELTRCAIELCQLKVPGICLLMPSVLKTMQRFSFENDTEVEDFMRVFVYFFYWNVEQIRAWDGRMELVSALWAKFQQIWNNANLEPLIYLLGEIIVLVLQEHWLQPEHAGIAANFAAEMIRNHSAESCPALVLVAFDLLISVFLFYHDECPGFDPLILCPNMLERWFVLFNTGCLIRKQDVSLHIIFFLTLQSMKPDDKDINAAFQYLQQWTEPDEEHTNPLMPDVVSEIEGLTSSGFQALLAVFGQNSEEET